MKTYIVELRVEADARFEIPIEADSEAEARRMVDEESNQMFELLIGRRLGSLDEHVKLMSVESITEKP